MNLPIRWNSVLFLLKDEYIYGTGQFQDGYLNIRGLTRRLTQVNTQISIPFILSSKGYGLLWNNYGLTDFNPADQFVELTPANASGEAVTVNTTGTSGNVRETRQTYSFTASVDGILAPVVIHFVAGCGTANGTEILSGY